jgi:hypothetical protein
MNSCFEWTYLPAVQLVAVSTTRGLLDARTKGRLRAETKSLYRVNASAPACDDLMKCNSLEHRIVLKQSTAVLMSSKWHQVSDAEGICEGLEEIQSRVGVILDVLELADSRNNPRCGARGWKACPMSLKLSMIISNRRALENRESTYQINLKCTHCQRG